MFTITPFTANLEIQRNRLLKSYNESFIIIITENTNLTKLCKQLYELFEHG